MLITCLSFSLCEPGLIRILRLWPPGEVCVPSSKECDSGNLRDFARHRAVEVERNIVGYVWFTCFEEFARGIVFHRRRTSLFQTVSTPLFPYLFGIHPAVRLGRVVNGIHPDISPHLIPHPAYGNGQCRCHSRFVVLTAMAAARAHVCSRGGSTVCVAYASRGTWGKTLKHWVVLIIVFIVVIVHRRPYVVIVSFAYIM